MQNNFQINQQFAQNLIKPNIQNNNQNNYNFPMQNNFQNNQQIDQNPIKPNIQNNNQNNYNFPMQNKFKKNIQQVNPPKANQNIHIYYQKVNQPITKQNVPNNYQNNNFQLIMENIPNNNGVVNQQKNYEINPKGFNDNKNYLQKAPMYNLIEEQKNNNMQNFQRGKYNSQKKLKIEISKQYEPHKIIQNTKKNENYIKQIQILPATQQVIKKDLPSSKNNNIIHKEEINANINQNNLNKKNNYNKQKNYIKCKSNDSIQIKPNFKINNINDFKKYPLKDKSNKNDLNLTPVEIPIKIGIENNENIGYINADNNDKNDNSKKLLKLSNIETTSTIYGNEKGNNIKKNKNNIQMPNNINNINQKREINNNENNIRRIPINNKITNIDELNNGNFNQFQAISNRVNNFAFYNMQPNYIGIPNS